MSTRAAIGRRNSAIRALALGAVLLFAVSLACGSEPDPTATQPAMATSAPSATPAPTPTAPPAAEPTESSMTHAETPTVAPATEAAPTATAVPSATANEEPADAPPVGTNVGNTLPHFEMTLADGSRVSTDVLAAQGQPVFLYFFATW